MKQIIYLSIVTIFIGCGQSQEEILRSRIKSTSVGYESSNIQIIEIDSCEYIKIMEFTSVSITHKGNCKYCKLTKLNP